MQRQERWKGESIYFYSFNLPYCKFKSLYCQITFFFLFCLSGEGDLWRLSGVWSVARGWRWHFPSPSLLPAHPLLILAAKWRDSYQALNDWVGLFSRYKTRMTKKDDKKNHKFPPCLPPFLFPLSTTAVLDTQTTCTVIYSTLYFMNCAYYSIRI